MYSYFKNVEVFKERPMLITRKEIKIKSSCIQFLIFTEGKSEILDFLKSLPRQPWWLPGRRRRCSNRQGRRSSCPAGYPTRLLYWCLKINRRHCIIIIFQSLVFASLLLKMDLPSRLRVFFVLLLIKFCFPLQIRKLDPLKVRDTEYKRWGKVRLWMMT